MQILESSLLGLRAARINLRSPQSTTQITLFPVIHAADPAFFQSVYDDAFSHDVVLVEGVRSPITRRITRAYRWMVGSRRLGLSLQPPYPDQATVTAETVHADLTGEEFRRVWAKVPLHLRLFVYVAGPAYGLWFRMFGTRRALAETLALDDQPSQARLLAWSPEKAALDGALLDARDARLVECLRSQIRRPSTDARRVAVVYGAGHMPAVLRAITTDDGYVAERCEWRTVFVA